MKRRDVDLRSITWALLVGVLMFFFAALMNRYVWGDGFDWWQAAVVAVPTTAFLVLSGVLQAPRARGRHSDVP